MINLMKADFYRIIRSKSLYLAFALLILIIALSIYNVEPGTIGIRASVGDITTNEPAVNELNAMNYQEIQDLNMSDYREIMLDTADYELDRNILAANMNLYYVFLFVAVLAVTSDFSGSSVKNTLSSATSRSKYFLSKLLFIALSCLVLFFVNTYIVYFANILFNGRHLASSLETVTKVTLLQVPPILTLVSILNGLAFAIRKTSIFNTVAIPFIIVCQIILDTATNLFKINETYLHYELQIMLGDLAHDPSKSYLLHSYLLCGAVILIFNLIGYFSFKKAEIK